MRKERNLLKKENALDVLNKNGIKYWVFNCLNCNNVINVNNQRIKSHTGKCKICCNRKEPYFHIYNRLLNNAKNKKVRANLTFSEFLSFTKINKCHYCLNKIYWKQYSYDHSNYIPNGYFLDRKTNNEYSLQNCVVCCSRCNYGKSNRYTYEEWYGMTEYFRLQNHK